jgi:hypothetical protein
MMICHGAKVGYPCDMCHHQLPHQHTGGCTKECPCGISSPCVMEKTTGYDGCIYDDDTELKGAGK